MQRVTILEARPDATVVVQADYYPPAIEHLPQPEQLPQPGMALVAADSGVPRRPGRISPHLNPIDLYVRTQRNQWDSRAAALLDVLA